MEMFRIKKFRMIGIISLLIISFLGFISPAYSQKERKDIRKGNELYQKALGDSGYVDTLRMQKAELYYRKALDKDINSYEGGFNLGASLFKEKKYSLAADQYKILASTGKEKSELASVYHNLGNSLFMDGKLQECIEAYKSSLRNNPNDTATKYNLAAAQKLLQDAKNNPQQNQDQQDQQDQEKQDQQQQDQQQQDQQKDQQEKQDQQQAKEDEKKEDGEEKQMQKPDQISKEDAERLLQAIQQDEKELQEKLKKEKAKTKRIRVEKEW